LDSDKEMSSSIKIDPDAAEVASKDPKFSPVFLSPGGTFVKPSRPTVNLTPNASKSVMGFADGESSPDAKERGDQAEGDVPGYDGQSWGIRKGDTQDLGLFGGAILVSLPSRLGDVSGFRQVPDHQEVFVDKETDISFIIEILAYEESTPDHEAALYHFNDLAQCNGAVSTSVDSNDVFTASKQVETPFMDGIPADVTKCVLIGHQSVAKFRGEGQGQDEVLIFLMLVRLPHVGTDLLISLNVPTTVTSIGDSVSIAQAELNAAQQEGAMTEKKNKKIDIDTLLTPDPPNDNEKELSTNVQFGLHTVRMAAQSIKVADWSLFA
jgi:hypothetical protein